MCKSKSSTKAINPSKKSNTNQPLPPFNTTTTSSTSHFYSSSSTATTTTTTSSSSKAAASSSSSSHSSLSIARTALPNNPNLYSFSEISSATNNFLSKRLTSSSSSSSSSWRCTLRRKDVVVVQRKLHRPLDQTRLHQLLSTISKIHHSSIVNLLGACPSTHHVFLVYEFAPGASLSTCLRTRINPSYTALSTWLSRIHIAADISDALRYIHHDSPVSAPLLVHNHVSSSSLIVSDDSLRARLCLLGAAQLSGEVGDSHLAPQAELRLQGKVTILLFLL